MIFHGITEDRDVEAFHTFKEVYKRLGYLEIIQATPSGICLGKFDHDLTTTETYR